jgi:hypothetical protein
MTDAERRLATVTENMGVLDTFWGYVHLHACEWKSFSGHLIRFSDNDDLGNLQDSQLVFLPGRKG